MALTHIEEVGNRLRDACSGSFQALDAREKAAISRLEHEARALSEVALAALVPLDRSLEHAGTSGQLHDWESNSTTIDTSQLEPAATTAEGLGQRWHGTFKHPSLEAS